MQNQINTHDNNFFKKLVEYSHEGISLIDKDFKVIYRSPSAQGVHGHGSVSPEGNQLADLIHPDDLNMVKELLTDLLDRQNASTSCTFRCKHAGGHYIWIECTYTNMFHEPEINAIACNFRDISKQKQAEELLQASINELSAYKYALDESAIVAITDQKGIIQHVNANFCKISKYSRQELIGQDHRIINSSYHSKSFIRNLWTTIANGKIWKNEMKNRAKDGTYYWVDTTIIPFLNEQGKPYQYVAIRSDISERKRYEEKIIESERFIKTITDNLPAMISYWTADLNCRFANKAVLDWYGKTPEEMQGINKSSLLKREEFELYWPHIQEVLKGNPQNFERSFSIKNGITKYIYTHYVPDFKDGKVLGFYSLIFDYSEIKDAQLEVLRKNAQIENLLENITDGFIALDQQRRYTYANKQIGKMLGIDPASLIGKSIWELFPDVIGSPTYLAIEEAYRENKYICHEDHYAPLRLWQENRIYPTGDHLSVFIRDISQRKAEEELNSLVAKFSQAFAEDTDLDESLVKMLNDIAHYGNFAVAECWLVQPGQNEITRIAKYANSTALNPFFENSSNIRFVKGRGLPGKTWESEVIQFWKDIDQRKDFLRAALAEQVGLKDAYGVPLFYQEEVVGVLLLCSNSAIEAYQEVLTALTTIGKHLGSEIKRKQLELELNQIFNFTPDILCTVHTNGFFKKVNPAMCSLLEYSEAELLNTPFLNFTHPAYKNSTAAELQNIINGNPTYYIENEYITKSGKIKCLAWTTTAASPQGIIYCSAKDITEKKELELLLQKATDLARIGAWEVDLVANTVKWSPMTCEIHETPADFVPNLDLGLEFYKEESRKEVASIVERLINSGVGFDIEAQIVTAKGNTKWVRVVGEAEFIGEQCSRIYGSFQDIDTLKRTELIAKEILEERNTILESIGDAFFAVDSNWIVTYWNKTAEEILQRSRAEMLNRMLWDMFPDTVGSHSYIKYHEAIEKNESVHFEDYLEELDRWYEVSAYPNGKGLSVYFKDITNRKKSEILLNELNTSLRKQARELAISNTELEQFAYVASHDLQEPLRMITSFLTQLELKYGNVIDERGKKYIHFAVDGAKRMRQIILDLLEFSRVGRLEESKKQVDFHKIITDILSLYRKQIEEQKALITYSQLPILHTYEAPIRQVFQNLISNSLKYQLEGTAPQIQISCEDKGKYWQFSVADNGIGISKEYHDKIFVIFQRLHNKEDYAGTGMGLAITKKIIENLGGKIWLESEETKGSTFYFTVKKEENELDSHFINRR